MSGEALFSLDARSLAERFGQVALSRILAGRDPYWSARLAASYAREVLTTAELGAVVVFTKRGPHGPN